MKNSQLAQNVKGFRIKRGYSQEELAEMAGLSLRTIQRIENGESEPRGESLRRLAASLGVLTEDIADRAMREDNGFLSLLNISALSFIFLPLLGIIVPLVLWILKRERIAGVDKTAKSLLNFQITWLIAGIVGLVLLVVYSETGCQLLGRISMGTPELAIVFWYFYNIALIIVNAVRAYKGKGVVYFPAIRFMRA